MAELELVDRVFEGHDVVAGRLDETDGQWPSLPLCTRADCFQERVRFEADLDSRRSHQQFNGSEADFSVELAPVALDFGEEPKVELVKLAGDAFQYLQQLKAGSTRLAYIVERYSSPSKTAQS